MELIIIELDELLFATHFYWFANVMGTFVQQQVAFISKRKAIEGNLEDGILEDVQRNRVLSEDHIDDNMLIVGDVLADVEETKVVDGEIRGTSRTGNLRKGENAGIVETTVPVI